MCPACTAVAWYVGPTHTNTKANKNYTTKPSKQLPTSGFDASELIIYICPPDHDPVVNSVVCFQGASHSKSWAMRGEEWYFLAAGRNPLIY